MKEGYNQDQLFKTLLNTTIARLRNGEIASANVADINLFTRKLILELIQAGQ